MVSLRLSPLVSLFSLSSVSLETSPVPLDSLLSVKSGLSVSPLELLSEPSKLVPFKSVPSFKSLFSLSPKEYFKEE